MSVEQDVVRLLGRWAAGSVVVGGLLAADPRTRAFGRQTAAWGAVDAAIALVGARRRAAGRTTEPGRLRRVLLVNAGLDVGYLAAGAWLLRRPRWRGDGVAVLVQGAFLLWLDATSARRLGAPGRPPGGADHGLPVVPRAQGHADRRAVPPPAPRLPVVVVHPLTVDVTALRALLAERFADRGWPEPSVLETTVEDPGSGMTLAAVSEGADLVVCCGGDGTVRAVASALAGTGVPLALLPAGTGNLLARNLRIPLELTQAVDVLLDGADRRLDLGTANGRRFAVMAGLGLDAAMVADASPRLKRAVGWPAYVVAGARHLLDRRMLVRLRVDGAPWRERRAHTVVVGNVGELQGGTRLFLDADPHDGVLDVAVVGPVGLAGWLRVAARVVSGSRRQDARMERLQFRRLELRLDRARPHELDGDCGEAVMAVDFQVLPGALTVRLPAPS